MTKDKEILELADVLGVACQIRCQECPVYARFKDDLELEGTGPFLISEDKKYIDCVDYIRATAVYDAGYRKQSEWISVEERKPSESGKYIVCTRKGNVYQTKFYAYPENKGGHWGQKDKGRSITHWMPLPEPPKMKGGAE